MLWFELIYVSEGAPDIWILTAKSNIEYQFMELNRTQL